jgi:hypothetical protein
MQVTVLKTRDSVCAGDDALAPHERTQTVDDSIRETVAFVDLTSRAYLASVNGVGHSWTAVLNGVAVARVTVDTIETQVERIELSAENTLHFRYHSATY